MIQTFNLPEINSTRPRIEFVVAEKVEQLCREIKNLEFSFSDARIRDAVKDAASLIRSRLNPPKAKSVIDA